MKNEEIEVIFEHLKVGDISNISDIQYDTLTAKNYSNLNGFSLLHYILLLRQFYFLEFIMKKFQQELLNDDWKNSVWFNNSYENNIPPIACLCWNIQYVRKFVKKEPNYNYVSKLVKYIDNLNEKYELENDNWVNQEVTHYNQKINNNKAVFDLFFPKERYLLNTIYYEKQVVASKQLKNNNVTFIMDEVGTGKTVSAMYCIRNIVDDCISENKCAKILIIAPYNKRLDWKLDIRRQLGRESYVIDGCDYATYLYDDEIKKVYFEKGEHCIFICGNKNNEKPESLNWWNKSDKTKWDLVVIDECHQSADNYKCLRSRCLVLMSATPIVLNTNKNICGGMDEKTFENHYKSLIGNIIYNDSEYYNYYNYKIQNAIDPININKPTDKDIFVNWFREDMIKESLTDRNIKFQDIKRKQPFKREAMKLFNSAKTRHICEDDDFIFYELYRKKETIKNDILIEKIDGILNTYLSDKSMDEVYENIKNNQFSSQNTKAEELFKYLLLDDNKNKSFIIFVEHVKVGELIYYSSCNNLLSFSKDKNIIALKLGNRKVSWNINEKIDEENFISDIKKRMITEKNKRTILITSGKVAGTGLNLGEFDGVIHYELPYTNTEIEQRYGRIDRIDTPNCKKEAKIMVFLTNIPYTNDRESETYFTANIMLDYCIKKVDRTCEYMPIRNTLLFHKDTAKKMKEEYYKDLTCIEQQLVNNSLIDLSSYEIRKQYHSAIGKLISDSNYAIIKEECGKQNDDKLNLATIINYCRDNVFSKDNEEYNIFMDKVNKVNKKIQEKYILDKFIKLEKEIIRWTDIIFENNINLIQDEFNNIDEFEISDNEEIYNDESYEINVEANGIEISELVEEKESNNEKLSDRIEILIEKLNNIEGKNFATKSSGIYCKNNKGKITSKSVIEFRGELNGNEFASQE